LRREWRAVEVVANVGMSVSEMVALLDVQKARLVETMRNGAV